MSAETGPDSADPVAEETEREPPRPDQQLGGQTRQYGEHEREAAEYRQEKRQELTVQEALTEAIGAIVREDYRAAARLCHETLLPTLSVSRDQLPVYDEYLSASRLAWDWDAVARFLDDPDRYRTPAGSSSTASVRLKLAGYESPERLRRRTVERTVRSLESIAVLQGAIPGELTQSSAIAGHKLQLGLQWQPWGYDSPDAVQITNPDLHPSFTISIGKPGNGKSTVVDALVEDAYAAGHKIIDMLDATDELENAMYDVPNQQNALRHKRKKLGLPPDFREATDYDAPDVEILHPLCEDFCRASLPYDTEEGEFVARPFVIPVADLDRRVLKAMMRNLTDQQENYLNEALMELDDHKEDWSLTDLRDAMASTSADDGLKRRVIAEISKLQSLGFLATREHPDAIDWDDIFESTDVITSFSMAMLDHDMHKLMSLVYLLDAVYRERNPTPPGVETSADEVSKYPRALAVFREIQDVAPSDAMISASSNAITRLEKQLQSSMQTLATKRRHTDLGIVGDTQQWLQLNARVRKNVDRVLMFKLDPGAAQSVFSQLTGDKQYDYAQEVGDFPRGDCSVIGSEWLSTGRAFEQPVTVAPPMCHHLDSEEDPDGWRTRVQHREAEEFRESPYSLDGTGEMRVTDWAIPPEQRNSAEGFSEFIDEAVEYVTASKKRVPKTMLRRAYVAYADDHDLELPSTPEEFGHWIREFYPSEEAGNAKMRRSSPLSGEAAYLSLQLTDRGEELAARVDDDPIKN